MTTEQGAPMLYAHTPNDDGDWHELADHLQVVAKLAAEHASAFGSENAAWWTGIFCPGWGLKHFMRNS